MLVDGIVPDNDAAHELANPNVRLWLFCEGLRLVLQHPIEKKYVIPLMVL